MAQETCQRFLSGRREGGNDEDQVRRVWRWGADAVDHGGVADAETTAQMHRPHGPECDHELPGRRVAAAAGRLLLGPGFRRQRIALLAATAITASRRVRSPTAAPWARL